MNINSVTIVGRACRDPEMRTASSGTGIASMNVAVDGPFDKATGQSSSCFFSVKAFGKTAETVCKYVRKGDQIGIQGRLSQHKFTARDGTERDVVEIIADVVQFLQKANREKEVPPAKPTFSAPIGYETPKDEDLPF